MYQIAVNFRFFMPFNFGWKAYFSACGWGVELLFFLPAAGAWGSVPNLLTKVPAFFENGGTRGQGVDFYLSARGRGVGLSAQLAYKSSCFF